jgi:hypothetical protein
VPHVHVNFGDWIAGVGVDQLNVHVEGNTLLVLDDILANEFTTDI